ncbi:MAG: hypothetical protein GAK45_01557 [Pseudomonas citronellolis]|nr:MAG: hypothetical protein GAK45_01557 [Pseudomonas citronellolis]
MEEHRALQFDRQGQLLFERFFLRRAGREVAIEIQPAFADGTHPFVVEQAAQATRGFRRPVPRIVRMYPGGAEQPLAIVELVAQRQSGFALGQAGAGQDQLADAGLTRTLQKRLALVGEAFMGEVDADVDQLHGAFLVRARSIAEPRLFP